MTLIRPEISSSIGNTPLVEIGPNLWAKNESLNPTGSIKIRMVYDIFIDALKRGLLKKGDEVIEATSGNTGIAMSYLAKKLGLRFTAVMPINMSDERKTIIRSYGAQIIEVGINDFLGAINERDRLAEKWGAFNPDQFGNILNVQCHKHNTGAEILEQVKKIDIHKVGIAAFVAGTGTGGTLMGVSEALKEVYPDMLVVAVEPSESAVMSGEDAGVHGIQGIGDGIVPPIVDMKKIDVVLKVSTEEAIDRTNRLYKEQGLYVGISSGANVLSAENLQRMFRHRGLTLTVLPDSRDRYLSML